MNLIDPNTKKSPAVWVGRTLSVLVAGMFLMSAVMKLAHPPSMAPQIAHLGLQDSLVTPLGILELTCVIIYLIPMTSILGAVLLTGYMGGAICTHLRVGESVLIPVLLAIAVWLAVYLRERRLHALLPIRRRE
jgi:DoxX-like family